MTNKLTTALVLASALTSGCAGANPSKAIDASKKALVGIDFSAEKSEPVVDRATAIRTNQCVDEEPGDDRRRCMGALGKPVKPVYDKVDAAYDAALKALDALAEASDELQELLNEAREVTK